MLTASNAVPGRSRIRSTSPITTRNGACRNTTTARSTRSSFSTASKSRRFSGWQTSGLSWITILRKRENFRRAFDGFEPAKIARYTPKKIEKLMQDAGIVRNRMKIEGAVLSARAYLDAMEKGPGFSRLLWDFVDGKPKVNRFRSTSQVPAETPVSRAMSKELARRGFKFVGPSIVYAFMQATGMVNDHVVSCYRHAALAALARR